MSTLNILSLSKLQYLGTFYNSYFPDTISFPTRVTARVAARETARVGASERNGVN